MTIEELYRKVYKDEGYTQVEIAEKLGYAGQATIAKMLATGITVDRLFDLIESIGGYRVVLEKVSASGRTIRKYEIERGLDGRKNK